jgi:hypothetical protein
VEKRSLSTPSKLIFKGLPLLIEKAFDLDLCPPPLINCGAVLQILNLHKKYFRGFVKMGIELRLGRNRLLA